MKLNIKVQDKSMTLNIGKGYNDWVWLSHYAARVYSKMIYPTGTYVPTMLFLNFQDDQFHPHPREKIKYYMEQNKITPENLQVRVKIRKGNHIYTQYQKKWQQQAYGSQRFMLTLNFMYNASNLNKKKDFFFKIKISFSMSDQVKHIYDDKKYDSILQLKLNQKQLGPNQSAFTGQIKLPYGQTTYKLFYCEKEIGDQYREVELGQNKIKKGDFLVRISPKYIPIQTINNQVNQQMKISENTHKIMQEKQMQAKKRNANNSLCCFSFQQLWTLIEKDHYDELSLGEYQNSTKQRIKITIDKSRNSLYEIFFYYFIIQNQQKDKKQQLGVTYQHVMHFLREYQVLPDMQSLLNFMQFYNSQGKFKSFRDTLDINHYAIKFPQFIAILLRSIQFVQTSTFMMKGQTFDVAVNKVFQRIIEIDNDQDQFSQFRRNIRENPKIIAYMRTNSDAIKNLFITQATSSLQNSGSSFVLMKEQIKIMLEMSELTAKNTDKIVQDCYMELHLSEDGIFYYNFLELLQWLALAIVSYDKQQERELESGDQEAMLLIQKMKFLLSKMVII